MVLLSSLGVSSSNTPTENTVAFQSALSIAASAGNVDIRVEPGEYHFDGPIVVSTPNRVTIRGEAVDGCNLHFHGGTGGIRIDYLDATKPPAADDLNFISHLSGGTALYFVGPVLPTATEGGLQATNIDVRGVNPGIEYFDCGIHLENAWHPFISRPDIQGKNPGGGDPTGEGVGMTFLAASGIHCTNVQAPQIRDVVMFHLDTAIKADGSQHGEGLNLQGGEIVGVGMGVDWSPAVYKPCIGISDIHINAYRKGIRIQNVGQMGVHNVHIYKTQLSKSNFAAVDMVNCHDNDISVRAFTPGCALHTNGWANGVVVTNSNFNRVSVMSGQWHRHGSSVVYVGSSSNNAHQIRHGTESSLLSAVGYMPGFTGQSNVAL